MIAKRLNQPLTMKSALAVCGLLVLATGLFFGGRAALRWLDGGPRSPRQVKREIHKFLVKHTGRSDFDKTDYDLNLKETVVQMQTNLVRFRQELSLLQTNLARTSVEVRKLRADGLTLVEQERSARSEAKTLENAATEKQVRLTNRLAELSLMQSNVLRAGTNVAALGDTVAALQQTALSLTNEISGLLTNIAAMTADVAIARTNRASATNSTSEVVSPAEKLTAMKKELAALQKALSAKQQELSSARRAAAEKRSDLATRERSLATARGTLATFQTNVLLLQSNVVFSLGQLTAKRAALQTKQQQTTANKDALAAKQKELAALTEQLQARQKELPERQKALTAKQQELTAQVAQFRKDITKKVGEAASYENIYYAIGQQLWVVDKLLASRDSIEQQQALSMAVEASQHAATGAEQPWLAARIWEAYLLPNLALADAKGRIGYTPASLLAQATAVFERADELPNAVKTLQLSLQLTLTNAPARADAVRYALGSALERSAHFDEALKLYREIEDTNYLKYTEQRIPATEAKRDQQRATKK